MPDDLNPDLNDLDLDGPAEEEADAGLLDQIADLLNGGPEGGPPMPGDLGAAVGDPGAPVAPVAPVDPVDPVAPVAPVVELPVEEPVAPVEPVVVPPVDAPPIVVPPVDVAPVGPVDVPVEPVDPAPVVPVDAAPVVPVDAAPVVPVDGAPVVPVDGAPVGPVDGAPVGPVDGAPVGPVDVAPVDAAPVGPVDSSDPISSPDGEPSVEDAGPVVATDPVPHEPVVIDLPVDVPTGELPAVVIDAVADPTASLDAVTSSLTDALGTPTTLPDFNLAAPTADHATLLLPDAPDMPPLQVTDVDHANGTVSALPVGAPTGTPPMTFPLADVEAAQAESGSPALSFAAGGIAGALSAVTVAAVASRRLRRA